MPKSILYLAKPTFGGWVSFTAHLALKYNLPLFKISKKTEILKNGMAKLRPYGYGVSYQNLSGPDACQLENPLITAIDKTYYEYLDSFPDGTSIVIHDPTEVKGKSTQKVIDNLRRFKVITIRKTVQRHLKERFDIDSIFLPHPFHEFTFKKDKNPGRSVSISRIDFDKHTDIILYANMQLENPIDIYGAKNDLYVFHHLKNKLGLNLDKYYKGQFSKDYELLSEMLKDVKFVVDMSAIKGDGGGSQYTFLEAIYQECALVLNREWVKDLTSEFKHGVNCYIVSNSDELVDLIKSNPNTKKIVENAKKLLREHVEVDWTVI